MIIGPITIRNYKLAIIFYLLGINAASAALALSPIPLRCTVIFYAWYLVFCACIPLLAIVLL